MAYNDVQLRAFSKIAYLDLEDAFLEESAKTGSPVKLSVLLKNMPNEAEEIRRMLGPQYEADLDTWSISAVHDTNLQNGFYACVIETSPGNAAVAFRGSEGMGNVDNVANDWIGADLGLLNSTCTQQHAEVERFLKKYTQDNHLLERYQNLTMTGHSLGGNLAEYATIASSHYGLDDNIEQCVSLDGPGFSGEFISKYSAEIQRMKDRLKHYRWSFVGTLLNDLPGAEYHFLSVSNSANMIDEEEYNCFTRHDTKYVDSDPVTGQFIYGEQDAFSKHTSLISKGIDHMPSLVGDVLLTVVAGIWLDVMWLKEDMFDNGELTSTGYTVIAGSIIAILVIGIPTVVTTLLTVVTALITVIIAAMVFELVYELAMTVLEVICDVLENIYNWGKELIGNIKEAVVSLFNSIGNWFDRHFNEGYKYSNNQPQVTVDTYKLRSYAQRLRDVNRRIDSIDRRMDSLYWSVGFFDLWKLVAADLLTGYSWRLSRCAGYLDDTANEFDQVENYLSNLL